MKLKDINQDHDTSNPVAKSLSLPMNRAKTEPSKKGKGSYKRKQKHKGKDLD